MKHRNIITEEWSRMAIDSLFERGTLSFDSTIWAFEIVEGSKFDRFMSVGHKVGNSYKR